MRKVGSKIFIVKFTFYMFLILVLACNTKKLLLESSKYISYMEDADNGFNKTSITSNILYKIQCKTPEYIALKEGLKDKALKNRIIQIDSSIWFNVKICDPKESKNPLKKYAGSLNEYNVLLDYFNFNAQNYFSLTYKGEKQKQIGYYFENSYGTAPYETLIIGYKLNDNLYNDDIQLDYFDDIFKNGIIKITITKEDLLNKPTLIL